jgi:hypothetical protein
LPSADIVSRICVAEFPPEKPMHRLHLLIALVRALTAAAAAQR